MAARARNPRETRESSEKIMNGTAANVYKEMQEAIKNSDEIT
jgi:molybdopterin converting factor small subunit